uniref:Uncharacterized protein n=1 Tax=Setaria viridis TaxID=4556 RepID=A0A4U6WNT1_SETVI|nr:hypothetical protein SEVIR_1G239551v2 [Setaria viridis]
MCQLVHVAMSAVRGTIVYRRVILDICCVCVR